MPRRWKEGRAPPPRDGRVVVVAVDITCTYIHTYIHTTCTILRRGQFYVGYASGAGDVDADCGMDMSLSSYPSLSLSLCVLLFLSCSYTLPAPSKRPFKRETKKRCTIICMYTRTSPKISPDPLPYPTLPYPTLPYPTSSPLTPPPPQKKKNRKKASNRPKCHSLSAPSQPHAKRNK